VYKAPAEGAWIGGLARDENNCIWFSEQFANKIARLCIDGISKKQDKLLPQSSVQAKEK
jgi:hypothetical protein